MDDDLDFYCPMEDPDSMCLQQMIECDMRANPFADADIVLNGDRGGGGGGGGDSDGQGQLDVSDLDSAHDSVDSFDGLGMDVTSHLTWLSPGSAADLNGDFEPTGLLVNPHTGLPAEQPQLLLRAVNPLVVTAAFADRSRLAEPQSTTKRLGSSANGRRRESWLDDDDDDDDDDDVDSEEEEDDDDDDLGGGVAVTRQRGEDAVTAAPTVSSTVVVVATAATTTASARGTHAQEHKRPKLSHINSLSEKVYPKPAYSYSCLIAMALKNSKTGSLPVSEIYSFMSENFPYFKTAPHGWKNSVRHNLSLNKCFEKIEKSAGNGSQKKGCLWALNPKKAEKMDDEVLKWSRKDPMAIKRSMACPENLELIERGCLSQLSCEPLENVQQSKVKPEVHAASIKLEGKRSPDTSISEMNLQNDLWSDLGDGRSHASPPLSSTESLHLTLDATLTTSKGLSNSPGDIYGRVVALPEDHYGTRGPHDHSRLLQQQNVPAAMIK